MLLDWRDRPVPTWLVVLGLIGASALLHWATQRFVLTPDVMADLVGEGGDATANGSIPTKALALAGYAFVPVQVLVHVAFAALVVQMVGLAAMTELTFGAAFRAVALAYPARLAGAAAQLVWLMRHGLAELDPTRAIVTPDSLVFYVVGSGPAQWWHHVLQPVSLSAMLWGLLLYGALRSVTDLSGRAAGAIVVGAWLVLTVLKLGVEFTLRGLVGV